MLLRNNLLNLKLRIQCCCVPLKLVLFCYGVSWDVYRNPRPGLPSAPVLTSHDAQGTVHPHLGNFQFFEICYRANKIKTVINHAYFRPVVNCETSF